MAKTTKEETPTLTAYCMKTKEKNVPMLKAVMNVINGKYIAQGVDADGNKLTTICGEVKAKEHVKSGRAKAGANFPK